MKKLIFALSVLALVFAACEENEKTAAYTGTYEGVYTFGNNDSTKAGIIPVMNNPFGNGLLLYSVLPFDTTDTVGLFRASSQIVPTMISVLKYIGVDLGQDSIKSMDATAQFKDNTMTLNLSYSFEMLEAEIGVNLIKFEGTKKSESTEDDAEVR